MQVDLHVDANINTGISLGMHYVDLSSIVTW